MLANALQTRAIRFAFVFGPPRPLPRETASAIHGAVCDELGTDDFSFRYQPVESSSVPGGKEGVEGFQVEISRPEGRGGYQVLVDCKGGQQSIRLLIAHEWPTTALALTCERFDLTAKAVFSKLGEPLVKVHAEARFHAQCRVKSHGLGFIKDHLLRTEAPWLAAVGEPIVFAGVRLEVESGECEEDSLHGPGRDLSIEVLRDDPSLVYLEVVSKWPAWDPSRKGGMVNVMERRPIDREPSEYVNEAYTYLQRVVESLAAKG